MTRAKRLEFLKLKLTEELVAMVMEKKSCSIQDAFDLLYASRTFSLLSDPKTELAIQRAGYVFSILEDEWNGAL